MPVSFAPTGLSSSLCKKTPMLRIDVVSGIIMYVSGWTCKGKGGRKKWKGPGQALTATGTLIPYGQHQTTPAARYYHSVQQNAGSWIKAPCRGCRTEKKGRSKGRT